MVAGRNWDRECAAWTRRAEAEDELAKRMPRRATHHKMKAKLFRRRAAICANEGTAMFPTLVREDGSVANATMVSSAIRGDVWAVYAEDDTGRSREPVATLDREEDALEAAGFCESPEPDTAWAQLTVPVTRDGDLDMSRARVQTYRVDGQGRPKL